MWQQRLWYDNIDACCLVEKEGYDRMMERDSIGVFLC